MACLCLMVVVVVGSLSIHHLILHFAKIIARDSVLVAKNDELINCKI